MKPDEGYIFYVVNPKSGSSSCKSIGESFLDYLRDRGFKVRVELTKSLEHAGELASEAAVDHDCSLFVVVGGDGTVREVCHGLEGSERKLLVVPGGTENLLASEFGFDENASTTIAAFEQDYTRWLDLGFIDGRCFTSIVGLGFDALIVDQVSGARSGHINHLDYFWPIWRTFWTHDFPVMKVKADGKEIFEGRGMVFVGNISRYALGLDILKGADFSDGLLDICIYKCASRTHLVKHSVLTVFKQHQRFSDVINCQAKEIEVTSVKPVRAEIDGDPGPDTPVKIKVLPRAVNCIVPENGKPSGMRTRVVRALG
jgi:YegS/Rv2252/BmrU family lipid kinase